MDLLSKLEVRKIKKSEFKKAMNILDNELGKDKVRSPSFLYNKFKEFHEFFIGVFLGGELIGIVCGFPRESYLLISEIAIDEKFHKRGFGKKLIKEFEKIALIKRYNKIKVGARGDAVHFYSSLGYKPFLLMQFKEKDYCEESFKFRIIKKKKINKEIIIEINNKDGYSKKELEYYRKKYPKAKFQYIFTKFL